MFRFLGDGHTYVIFDCQVPSYINEKHQKVVLKHHIINHMLDRKKDPRYNDTDGYVCDDKENLWRMNPKERGCTPGIIGFMAEKAYAADSNFIVLADENILKDFFGKMVLETPEKEKEKASQNYASIIKSILTAIHHPSYFKVDAKMPEISIDLMEAAERHLAKEIKARRQSDAKIIKELFVEKLGDSQALPKDDAYSFVVMNCSHPEYLLPRTSKSRSGKVLTKHGLDKTEITNRAHVEMIKQMGKCDPKENIWYMTQSTGFVNSKRKKAIQYLTYDHRTNGLGCSPTQENLSVFNRHELCHDYMAYLLHPGYYLKQFNKPRECSPSKNPTKFPELSANAWRSTSSSSRRKTDHNPLLVNGGY